MVKKVLFINELSPASIIPELLVNAGHEVYESYDAETGLQSLETESYDLIIVMESGVVESWELCRRVRRLTTSPLMVISPEAGPEACVNALGAGADYFIRKSFGPMELLARINALFQRASTRQPANLVS